MLLPLCSVVSYVYYIWRDFLLQHFINATKGFVENDLSCRIIFLCCCSFPGALSIGREHTHTQPVIHLAKDTKTSRNRREL